MSFANYLNKMSSHKIKINKKISIWESHDLKKGSKGEQITRDFLRKYHIPFKEQKIFTDLYYKNKEFPLRFDFQIWVNEKDWILLEIDGLQHNKIVNFGGNQTQEQLEENLKENIERDNLKNEYCKNHNIKLERIIWDSNKDKLIKNLTIMIRKYKKSTI